MVWRVRGVVRGAGSGLEGGSRAGEREVEVSIRERIRRADGYFTESGEYSYQPLPLWAMAIPVTFMLGVIGACGYALWALLR